MKALVRLSFAALAAAMVALPGTASAHGGGKWKDDFRDRFERREFRDEHRHRHHVPPGHWSKHRHHRDVVIRERVIYEPVYAPAPAPEPAVVINLPPIVIPF